MEKVYETIDYNMFKNLDGNRIIRDSHVRSLVDAIRKNDMKLPLIVNKKMEILDGQHTLEARKILKKVVQYIIRERLGIKDVRKVNASQHKWLNQDYLMSYYRLGNKEYAMLEYFVREYKLGIMFSVGLLTGKPRDPDRREFMDGKFKVTTFNRADEYAKRIHKVSEYLPFWKHDKFMRALVQCFEHPKFSWKLFLDKLENKSIKLQKQASRNDYMLALERFYNHGTNTRNRIAFDQFEPVPGNRRS